MPASSVTGPKSNQTSASESKPAPGNSRTSAALIPDPPLAPEAAEFLFRTGLVDASSDSGVAAHIQYAVGSPLAHTNDELEMILETLLREVDAVLPAVASIE
jgi:hypothetical protein